MSDIIVKRNSFTSPEAIDAFFDHVGKREYLAKAAVEAAEEFRRKKGISERYEHLLDIGCGSGSTTVEFLKYFSRVTAIDISEGQIAKAKDAHSGDNVNFLVAPAEKIPVEDSSVDVIVSIFALHNFKLDEFLKECHRILKPNGVITLVGYEVINPHPRSSSPDNISGAKLMLRMWDDLKQYAKEISHLEWHILDRHYQLYQQIHGFKKSRDDSKSFSVNMSLKIFRDSCFSIPFYSLPKSKKIFDAAVEELKKEWGVEHLPDDKVDITVTHQMNIITLSKI